MFTILVFLSSVGLLGVYVNGNYIPGGAYSPASYSQDGDVIVSAEVVTLLDELSSDIDVILQRHSAHQRRLDSLVDTANENANTESRIKKRLQPQRLRIVAQQNTRLDKLSEHIADIKDLRDKINNLQKEADNARKTIDSELQPQIAQFQQDIEDFKPVDAEQNKNIAEAETRAQTNSVRITAILDEILNDTQELYDQETGVTVAVDANNQRTGAGGNVFVDHGANSQASRISFNPPLSEIPTTVFTGYSGLHTQRYNKGYNDGKGRLQFSTSNVVFDDHALLRGFDLSSGGEYFLGAPVSLGAMTHLKLAELQTPTHRDFIGLDFTRRDP